LQEYRDVIGDKVYSPREYIEHMLHLTDEEKEVRRRYYTGIFEEHEMTKKNGNN
jgi:hypothetical protein